MWTLSLTLLSLLSCFSVSTAADGICAGATWNPKGITVAGGKGLGSALNQLSSPNGLFVDGRTVYVADTDNGRIVKWAFGAISGEVVANGDHAANGSKLLRQPTKVVLDQEGTMFVCDRNNIRVLRYQRGSQQGETIMSNISCWGLAVDKRGSVYASDLEANRVMKWPGNELVAGGNGRGNAMNQLWSPYNLFVDDEQTIFIVDRGNNRIIKWRAGAQQGELVIESKGFGNDDDQLYKPMGVTVDEMGSVYVVEYINTRVVRWLPNAQSGSVIAGGPGYGSASNQLYFPRDVAFDRYGNLYVADTNNHRVQMYAIDKSACTSGTAH